MSTPASIIQFLVEDAVRSLLMSAGIAGVGVYRSADSADAAALQDRIEVLAEDATPEFPDCPPELQAAANMIVPVSVAIVTSVASTEEGGVTTENPRDKHLIVFGQVQDALMIDALPAALNAQSIVGLHVGFCSWEGQTRPTAEGNHYRSEIRWNVHACATRE